MSHKRLKQLFVTSIDDTPSLRLARVVNQAEEAKVANEIRVYEKVAKIRCFELNREIEMLEKFLEELKITTGYLKDTPIVNVWRELRSRVAWRKGIYESQAPNLG